MIKTALQFIGRTIVVLALVGWAGGIAAGEVGAQTCGSQLVIQKITGCNWQGDVGGGSCSPVYESQPYSVTSCQAIGSTTCKTTQGVCGSGDTGVCVGQSETVCKNRSSISSNAAAQLCGVKDCWVTGGPTSPPPPPSCGNGTCGSGETCSNCPADCGECKTYVWANINVLVYGENGLEAPSDRKEEPSSGNNTCKGYFGHSSTGKGWSNYNICQNIWLLDMAKADKSMYISGINSKYSGCRVELNGVVIDSSFANGTCSVPSRTYKQYDDRLVIHLLKPTPTPTEAPTPCPAVTTPSGLTATYDGGANSTFGWNAVSNTSTPVTYGLQIDNYGSGWASDTCAGTVQGGDTCNLSYTGTSFTKATNLGNNYRWRVKANNACGNTSNWTAWTNYNVPTPPNCTSFGGTTNITRNTNSTHQVLASGDPTRGQLAWRCGAGGTWGAWQMIGDLTRA